MPIIGLIVFIKKGFKNDKTTSNKMDILKGKQHFQNVRWSRIWRTNKAQSSSNGGKPQNS